MKKLNNNNQVKDREEIVCNIWTRRHLCGKKFRSEVEFLRHVHEEHKDYL